MELIIPEKYLIRWEEYTKFTGKHRADFFAARYVFAAPDAANLEAGYTIYIDTYDQQRENKKLISCGGHSEHYSGAYHLQVPNYPKEFIYTALKTENREEGKKYKRYKFTALELQALYSGYSLTEIISVLAKVNIYANNGTRLAGEVVAEKLIVGKQCGCWFYSDELDTKRRVGTKGVSILGEIEGEHEETVKSMISEKLKRQRQIQSKMDSISLELFRLKSLEEWVRKTEAAKLVSDAAQNIAAIVQNADSLRMKFLQEQVKCNEMYAEIEDDFMLAVRDFLKK